MPFLLLNFCTVWVHNQTDFVLLNQMAKGALTLRWLTLIETIHSLNFCLNSVHKGKFVVHYTINKNKCTNLISNLKQYLNCTEQPVSSPRSLYALHSRDLQSSGRQSNMHVDTMGTNNFWNRMFQNQSDCHCFSLNFCRHNGLKNFWSCMFKRPESLCYHDLIKS